MKLHSKSIIAAILMAGCLSMNSLADDKPVSDNDQIKIVTTIFPEYDWVMNILGEHAPDADVTMLLDNGVDLHSFQPTAEDILKISTCDLFIYVGGESDEWVEDALEQAVNDDMAVINLMDILGSTVKEEEVVEGMQDEEHGHEEDSEDHDHEEDSGEHDHGEEPEYDEHIWLSLRNASILMRAISETLQEINPAGAVDYENNTSACIEQLDTLDQKYQDTVDQASVSTLLFGDRFPFRYLVDDYGLSYYAAFAGCSAETEASFETISFLANKVDELSLHAVMTIEGTDHRIAETIIQNTQTKDQKILSMDSMQSVTAKDVEDGASYFSIMEKNLSVLKEALE